MVMLGKLKASLFSFQQKQGYTVLSNHDRKSNPFPTNFLPIAHHVNHWLIFLYMLIIFRESYILLHRPRPILRGVGSAKMIVNLRQFEEAVSMVESHNHI